MGRGIVIYEVEPSAEKRSFSGMALSFFVSSVALGKAAISFLLQNYQTATKSFHDTVKCSFVAIHLMLL